QIHSHDGYEVKTEGDGFMVAFGSARKAVQCAIAIQRAFAKRNDDAEEPMLVRIGLHTGEPVQENNDFYGTQVTQAARIANEANGGQILVSALLKELTDASGDISFSEGRDVELKGLGTQQIFGVTWEQT
ncbi:MAG: adenylate/guanylate cyclase domain-containing protein, partial [Chloroflexi bacterium]|nr:adenylate/guanylate cyclase domain-containing protein [Chloroflexota bacterium]